MVNDERKYVYDLLHCLVGQPLSFGYKASDIDLFDLGFGQCTKIANGQEETKVCSYALHILCEIKVIWRNENKHIDVYCADTSSEQFQATMNHLLNLKVRRVALSEKNDLWLDFGTCWIVFVTEENGEESWRFFSPAQDAPHLVVADSWFRLDS